MNTNDVVPLNNTNYKCLGMQLRTFKAGFHHRWDAFPILKNDCVF